MTKQPFSLDKLGAQLAGVLQKESAAFLLGQSQNFADLGPDVINLVFRDEVFAAMPAVLEVPDDASLEMLAMSEEINAERALTSQLIAKAEREKSERVAALRAAAKGVAGKVASTIFGLLAGGFGKLVAGA